MKLFSAFCSAVTKPLVNASGWLVCFYHSAPPVTEKRTGRYPNFDLLRLLLAAEVAFVHAWAAVDESFDWAGYVMAVPAFLAISGFLVLQSYSESGSWRVFIRKRALRLLPALLLALLLSYVLLGKEVMFNSVLTWLSGGLYTPSGSTNGPLWSLAWEELAYLLLAVLWLLGAYKLPFWIWLLWFVSIMLVWATSHLAPHRQIIFFLAPAFFTGNLMFLYRRHLLDVQPLIPWLAFYIMLQWRFVPDAQLFGGASLLLVQAFAVVWVGMAGLKVVPFRFPDISYGVYIFHMPIIQYLYFKQGVDSLNTMLIVGGCLLLPFCLASWYGLEKPALRFKREPFTARLSSRDPRTPSVE